MNKFLLSFRFNGSKIIKTILCLARDEKVYRGYCDASQVSNSHDSTGLSPTHQRKWDVTTTVNQLCLQRCWSAVSELHRPEAFLLLVIILQWPRAPNWNTFSSTWLINTIWSSLSLSDHEKMVTSPPRSLCGVETSAHGDEWPANGLDMENKPELHNKIYSWHK